MSSLLILLLLIFLILVQFSLLPLNLAFLAVLAGGLFIKDFNKLMWLTLVSFLVAVFGNFGWGNILIAYSLSLFLMNLVTFLLPNNRLSKALVIFLALPASELGIIAAMRLG